MEKVCPIIPMKAGAGFLVEYKLEYWVRLFRRIRV